MTKFFILPILFLLMLLSLGCTRNEAQRDFEQDAYSQPFGYTERSFQGEIQKVDEDDWRISPLFQGLVNINPPFPNPATTSQSIQFEIDVVASQSVNGLEVITRFADGSPRVLYQEFESLPTSLSTFQINPLEFAQFDNPEGARGLHRIFIFDGRGQMITYGDILVE